MRHWWRLATRNWRVRPGRTAAATLAIALGVGTVVSVTCFYESVRRSIGDQLSTRWRGKSHLNIEPALGHWGRLPESLAVELAGMENVARGSARLKRRMELVVPPRSDGAGGGVSSKVGAEEDVDAIGIDPRVEYEFREVQGLQGRRIEADESGVILLEAQTAEKLGLRMGDTVHLRADWGKPEHPFTVIGLMHLHRVAKFQFPTVIVPLPDLQRVKNEPHQVTVIDLMLTDYSVESVRRTAEHVADRLGALGISAEVTTAEARIQQLEEAERITHMVLVLVAFVAMLTAFFIIVTTMSMGLIERIGQLGMLRCVGMTRWQLCVLVLVEVMPLGVAGIALGLPIGVGLTQIGASFVPEYVQGVAISRWGVWLAVAGGLITTLFSAALLLVQVSRVSPLAAANPESQPRRAGWPVVAALAGAALLLAHNGMVKHTPSEAWFEPGVACASVASGYGGFVLLTPAMVWLIGGPVVAMVAPLLRLKRRLAQDQVRRAPWRSAGVCWMLMVGLSLIVYIAARAEGIIAAWDFPKALPEAFVWSNSRFPAESRAKVEALPGVAELTVVSAFFCELRTPNPRAPWARAEIARGGWLRGAFVAGELDRFLAMTRLSFLEGNLDDAVAKLQRGGYVLLPPEAAHTLNVSRGDRVDIRLGGRVASFEVAGVVQSPALDIAVTYFQADSYMMQAASVSVLGTIADAERCFGLRELGMFLLNVKLPSARRPAAFEADEPPGVDARSVFQAMIDWQSSLPNEKDVLEAVVPQVQARLADPAAPFDALAVQTVQRYRIVRQSIAEDWSALRPADRWAVFREPLVRHRVLQVGGQLGRPDTMAGSVRLLKQQIDRDIREVTLLMTAMPAVALAVAAFGVANLMMVSVTARTRQIAVLRAVGATKSQIVRLVFAEAISLGLLGCVVGVVLGIQTSWSAAEITERIVGISFPCVIPWSNVWMGTALTVGVCVLAGIGPARHAARNNIVDAMQAR